MQASAYTTAGLDCEGKGTCMLVCNYSNKVTLSSGSAGTRHVSIYYDFESKKIYGGIMGWYCKYFSRS